MIRISEQLIQDLVADLRRLENMLRQIPPDEIPGDWTANRNGETPDLVNQEFSFSGGRADIVATFCNRTNLVIAEVKGWTADLSALEQLIWYLDNRQQSAELTGKNAVGFLVAQDFSGIAPKDIPHNVFLFKFDLSREVPFRHLTPSDLPAPQASDEDSGPNLARSQSQFVRFEDRHVRYIQDRALQDAFREIANCFLPEDDQVRKPWVCINPKSEHVNVRFRGEYIVSLWARRNKFRVQVASEATGHEVTARNWADQVRGKIKSQIDGLMARVDQSVPDEIKQIRLV